MLTIYIFDLTGKDTIPADANQSLQVSSRGKSKTVQHLRATPHQDEPPIHEVASHGDAIHTTKFIEQEQMEGISATARRRLGRRRYGGRRRQGQGGNRRGRRERGRQGRRRNGRGYYGQRAGRGRNRRGRIRIVNIAIDCDYCINNPIPFLFETLC